MKQGIVYLVGSGPGDPGLFTVKAMEVLLKADCIIYDYLANHALLGELQGEKIYVGKKGSDHTLPQEEINRLIVKKAKEGKIVVRLKGGDPFIFGRGGEEAEELIEAGVRFSVIPGISSFYSSPAYAGIPLTHRDHANAFEVITGHRRDDAPQGEDINFPEYNSQKTFVFLMGMKNLGYISEQLIEQKKFPGDTPAAVISWGTTPKQKAAAGTLKDIAGIAKSEGVKAPAIILVGSVVKLRDKLRWFDNLPLFGRKIVITRTREQASVLSKKLADLGAWVIEFPTIEIKKKADMRELRTAIEEIALYTWVIFTSQNAVRMFFDALKENGMDARNLYYSKIACIGPATANELKKYAIEPDLVPSEYVAEDIINEMKKIGITNNRVLLPCATEARQTLKEGLQNLGAEVSRIHIYDTIIPDTIAEEVKEEVESADMVTFASSSTAKNFFRIFKSTEARLACIGPITADTVRSLGYEPDITASEYTIDGLVDSILEYYSGRE